MPIRYPLALYRAGWDDLSDFVVVHNEDAEADARREGYRMLSEPVEPPRPAPTPVEDDDDDDAPAAPRRGRPRRAAQ